MTLTPRQFKGYVDLLHMIYVVDCFGVRDLILLAYYESRATPKQENDAQILYRGGRLR